MKWNDMNLRPGFVFLSIKIHGFDLILCWSVDRYRLECFVWLKNFKFAKNYCFFIYSFNTYLNKSIYVLNKQPPWSIIHQHWSQISHNILLGMIRVTSIKTLSFPILRCLLAQLLIFAKNKEIKCIIRKIVTIWSIYGN